MLRVTLHGGEPAVHFEVALVWEVVRDIRRAITERLAAHDRGVRDATAIVVSELAENVLKYSHVEPDAKSARQPGLTVHVHSDRIVVRSENQARSAEDAADVARVIEELRVHDDPEALYAQVVEDSLEVVASGVSRQGFYRIAVVAGFTLRARVEGGWLTITAERSLK